MRLPAGVRDWLPDELARKREIEQKMRAVFGRWSYQEVQTPGFERFDVLEFGLGEALTDQTFRFSDRRANALALRPEMTTPIARLVSTRMRDDPLPLRLSYVAPAYRYEEPQEGRMREFTQAGVELIGSDDVDADAEVLFMAVEALDAVGLSDACFDINDANVVDGVLATLGIPEEKRKECKALIGERNVVALRRYGEPRLVEYAMLRGEREALERARPLCGTPVSRAALERLSQLLDRASALGIASRVNVDFALLRDLEYYTGFVFEGYVDEIGFSLCGGGRYDNLLPRFGHDVPAVGWTAGIERVLIALERRGRHLERKRPRIDLLVAGSDVVAARERAAGNVVRFASGELSDEALIADAQAHGIGRILVARNGKIRELKVRKAPALPAETVHPFGEAPH
ncbi:MAG: ATP phosphoribosyltransferase regulatory subunit [Candidatus Eremiobacteraeota bacterium]|nr:ATP phosphoribosyltransferase regulatory subunit [Candidatus Eremiobacteraeota bacterium]